MVLWTDFSGSIVVLLKWDFSEIKHRLTKKNNSFENDWTVLIKKSGCSKRIPLGDGDSNGDDNGDCNSNGDGNGDGNSNGDDNGDGISNAESEVIVMVMIKSTAMVSFNDNLNVILKASSIVVELVTVTVW